MAAFVFWLALFFSVVTYGGNNPLALTVCALAIYLLLPVSFLLAGVTPVAREPVWACVAILAFLGFWIWIQTITLPFGLFVNPIWPDVEGIALNSRPMISVNPGDMQLGFVKLALPFGFFLNSMLLFASDVRALRALKIIAIGGGVLAMAGIVQFAAAPKTLLFAEKLHYLDSLTGTFINRNTAGTFFGMLCILLFALSWHAWRNIDVRRLWASLDAGRRSNQSRQIGMLMLFCLCGLASLMALLLTKSRAATGATLLALILLSFLMATGKGGVRTQTGFSRPVGGGLLRRIGAALLIAAAILLAFVVLGGRVVLRGEVRGIDDSRFCILPGVASAIGDYWPMGAGLTSFRDIFPAYRDPLCGIHGVWDKAHNVYAEGLFTLGIAFPIVFLPAVFILLRIYRRGARVRRRMHFASSIGFASLLLVAVHSSLDFSLQIPGFSSFFAAITGLLVTICLQDSSRRRSTPPQQMVPQSVLEERADVAGVVPAGRLGGD